VIAQTRAELLKIRSTRTTVGLLLGLLGLVLLGVLLTGFLDERFSLSQADTQRDLLGIGSVASLFAAIAGVLVICSEYRFGTIRPTVLFTPRRSRVLLAKLGAGMLAGLAFGVVAEGIAFGLGSAILSGRGIDLSLDGRDVALIVLGSTVGAALWAGIGLGLGSIVRNQVAAIVGLLAWVFVVDNLLFGLVPSVGRYTPSMATNALVGGTEADLVSPGTGAALLVVWAAVLVGAGIALTARRDVN
jgi:ABC-type transport system involved in multi-copper enzyme maturation permease subunit